MRKIFIAFLSILFLNIPASAQKGAQTHSDFLNGENRVGGGIAYFDDAGNELFRIATFPGDEKVSYYFPSGTVSKNTSFSYFPNQTKFGISFSIIDSLNVEDMRYRIISKGEDSTDWKIPNGRKVKQSEYNGQTRTNIFLPYMDFPAQVVKIQLYNIKDPESLITQIVTTKAVTKPSVEAFANIYNPEVNKIGPKNVETRFLINLGYTQLYDFYQIKGSSLFLQTDNTPFLYSVSIIESFGKQSDTIPIPTSWTIVSKTQLKNSPIPIQSFNSNSDSIYWTEIPAHIFKPNRNYEIRIGSFFGKNSGDDKIAANSIKFKVVKFVSPREKILRAFIYVFSALLLLSLVVFFVFRNRQRKKLNAQQQLTTEAKLKLQSIRSQLNPHFIFNALSGIQNLMNKNETEKANQYLGTFSRLTRNVLDDSNKETITLDNEIKLLDDYLKMEQLRFGFQYQINADEALDRHNIEIPSMLLQPFAENAVKHGIASLKDAGKINIDFKRSGDNIVMSVSDNGKGFDVSKEYNGMGLQLSKNRISLLNTVYKITPLDLQIRSSAKGAEAVITLQNWLS